MGDHRQRTNQVGVSCQGLVLISLRAITDRCHFNPISISQRDHISPVIQTQAASCKDQTATKISRWLPSPKDHQAAPWTKHGPLRDRKAEADPIKYHPTREVPILSAEINHFYEFIIVRTDHPIPVAVPLDWVWICQNFVDHYP